MSKEDEIERQIQHEGLTAPRLTPDTITKKIVRHEYCVFNKVLTVCCLTLENGFTVTGESACASPENFNRDIGRDIAYHNAREKVWQLEGYLLRERLHSHSK